MQDGACRDDGRNVSRATARKTPCTRGGQEVIENIQTAQPESTGTIQISDKRQQKRNVNGIRIENVYPNPDQPRKSFDPTELRELADSILHSGLMQPIIVWPCESAQGKYMIVAGERRWRASQLAGLTHIDAIVRKDLDAAGLAELALVENLLRANLTLLEEAHAYQAMLNSGHTVETLSVVMGKKRSWRISERLALLKLKPEHQAALQGGELNPSQAYEMSRLAPEDQDRLARAIRGGKCETFRQLRQMTQALLDEAAQIPMFRELEQLSDREIY